MGTAKKPTEIWKSPQSLNCKWVEVSNLGRVRTLDHRSFFLLKGRKVSRLELGTELKRFKDSRGRYMVVAGSPQRSSLVHRLVAECFVKNPKPKEYNYVFFKNRKIDDCRASNLAWGAINDKGYMMRGKNSVYKIKVFSCGEEIGEYFGTGEVARALGVSKQAVYTALIEGRHCQGYELRGCKNNGDAPVKCLGDADECLCTTLPDAIYTKKDVYRNGC